jgi:hypothetical protein
LPKPKTAVEGLSSSTVIGNRHRGQHRIQDILEGTRILSSTVAFRRSTGSIESMS